ncbi:MULTISPECIES: DedA family protein [Paenibacillus]|uniref:DedA family protein n=1 Tax=Paenibacillus TaxID=44249 RepID=UPI0022B87827|nr:DedA family protein [Paenibacillus caseinilyticus]MCZ8518155.1 DedA family protein [Paenibacillus caseinilyticus]
MTTDTLLALIEQYGYAALFFSLWLGIVGAPIPDEAVVMTGGAVTASGLLETVPAFVLTYLGVISGLSLGYVLGRYAGMPILDRLKRKPKMERYILRSEELVKRYGNLSLVISYFLPVVRHVLPYLLGLNRMPFRRYAVISYSTGLLWTLLFFLLGRYAGAHAEETLRYLSGQGLRFLWIPAAAAVMWWAFQAARRRQERELVRKNSSS